MKGDFSRATFDPRKGYSGVLMQQGRVQLDSDWNEQEAIEEFRDSKTAIDTVGYDGAPKHDAGFRVYFAPDGSDLIISPGSYYVHGRICRIESTWVPATPKNATTLTLSRWHVDEGDFAPGQFVEIASPQLPALVVRLTAANRNTQEVSFAGSLPVAPGYQIRRLTTYLTQPFLPNPPYGSTVSGSPTLALPMGRNYLAYLDVWSRHVTSLDDPGIREVALGGPDTTTRVQTVWQLKIWPPPGGAGAGQAVPTNATCSTPLPSWEAAVAGSTGLLSARTGPTPPTQPCILPPGAGFLGLENKLYRVEVHEGGTLPSGPVKFKWSRENGSPVFPISTLTGGGFTVPEGPDGVLGLTGGDTVEQVDDEILLGPGAGPILTFQKDPTTGAVTLNNAPDLDLHPQLRRWESPPVAAGAAWTGLEQNIEVSFGPGDYRVGDYWLIPARTATAQIDWPVDGAGSPVPQPAEGIVHHYSRIGLVTTAGALYVQDCRRIFPPLNELKATYTCCTYTVGDSISHVGDFTLIQDAVNRLPLAGGRICIFAGTYRENVDISNRKNVRISGCGDRTVISAADDDLPVFKLTASTGTTISSLAIQAPDDAPGIFADYQSSNRGITIEDVLIKAGEESAIRFRGSRDVTIRRCRIVMTEENSGNPGIFLQVVNGLVAGNCFTGELYEMSDARARILPGSLPVHGLQLGGGCERMRVIDNLFEGCTGQGITFGSVRRRYASGQTGPAGTSGALSHPCADCETPSNTDPPIEPGAPAVTWWLESEGDIYRVELIDNRVSGAGLDGVGVAHFFDHTRNFNSTGAIRVEDLLVVGNHIEFCVRRKFASIPMTMFDHMAVGGISLAIVDGGVFRDNRIENIGYWGELPVVGIWIWEGQGLEFSRNHVLNVLQVSKADPATSNSGAAQMLTLIGRRGGIVIGSVSPLDTGNVTCMSFGDDDDDVNQARTRHSMTAAHFENNTVDVAGGQALYCWAWGPVMVISNRFASHGFGARQLLDLAKDPARVQGSPGSRLAWAPLVISVVSVVITPPPIVQSMAKNAPAEDEPFEQVPQGAGRVLFDDNQCFARVEREFDPSRPGADVDIQHAVLVSSNDENGFQNNQIDVEIDNCVMPLASLVYATNSVRVVSNRFKETLGMAMYSARTYGRLNITAHNQGNHCFNVQSPSQIVDTPNQVLTNNFGKSCSPTLLSEMDRRFTTLLA